MQIPRINEGFTDIYGNYYDKISEIAYKKGELFNNAGRYITESDRNDTMFGDNLTIGSYLYQSYYNEKRYHKISKCFADITTNELSEARLIQKLRELQDKIKLTTFPYGVITLDGKVIGQTGKFYYDEITILDYIKINKPINPFLVYKKVLDVLKEMSDNGIIYIDVNPNNFMLNPNSDKIKIHTIDFEPERIRFDCENAINYLFENYKCMINYLNGLQKIDKQVGLFCNNEDFDDCYKQLEDMNKKYIKSLIR